MEPIKQTWRTGRNREIFSWYIMPVVAPKAVILLVHGFGEYSWIYKNWAKKFAYNGFVFLSWDHYGHGISDGEQGFIRNYEQFLLEIDLALTKVGEIFPKVPIILYGHGMGGTIALNYCIRRTSPIAMLVVTSPFLELTKKPARIENIMKFFLSFIPGITLKLQIYAEQQTHDDEEIKKYRNDKLLNNKISPHLYLVLCRAGKYALNNANRIKIPTLLMHGNADQIASYKATERISKTISNATFIEWPNLYHELHHENNQNEVYVNIQEWIEHYLSI